jgi:hypothetical protein
MNLRVGWCDYFMIGSCWPRLYIGGPVLVLRWFMLFYSGPYISCNGSCWLMLVTTFYDDSVAVQRWFMSVGVNFRLFSSWFMLACTVHIFLQIFFFNFSFHNFSPSNPHPTPSSFSFSIFNFPFSSTTPQTAASPIMKTSRPFIFQPRK